MLMVMLQGLLAERFKLVLHRETRTISALVLEAAKSGPKLEKAEAGESVTNTSTSNTRVIIDVHNTDMDAFARVLARNMDLPVVNDTGLQGTFNFELQWTPESNRPVAGGTIEGASVFTAIQEQLGLRLRSQKAPVEIPRHRSRGKTFGKLRNAVLFLAAAHRPRSAGLNPRSERRSRRVHNSGSIAAGFVYFPVARMRAAVVQSSTTVK